jgi:hypothetical protein
MPFGRRHGRSRSSIPSLPPPSPVDSRPRAFWQRFHPHAEIIALLRARIEQEPVEAGQAVQWCVTHGVRGPIDARLINWEPDYEEPYYRELAAHSKRVYLFRNEYCFYLRARSLLKFRSLATRATYSIHRIRWRLSCGVTPGLRGARYGAKR